MLNRPLLAVLFGAVAVCATGAVPQVAGSSAQAQVRAQVRPGTLPVTQPARRRTIKHTTVRRTVVVAPVRPLPAVRPPYWGRVVAGVTLGAVIAVAVASTVPKAPSTTLCWFWTDSAKTHGYWDYCTPPVQ